MAMHLLGVIEAYKQNQIIDWNIFILVQFTITITHLMTHFFNEYGDYEADKFNKKDGAWTGGSKILKNDLLPKRTALVLGVLFLFLSILGGVLTLIYYIFYMENTMLINIFGFFIYGLSVLFLSIAYSIKPFKLASHALGELIVSYVLTFATPIIGCLIQNGFITQTFILSLLPLFINNVSRMIVMNIPDKDGDEKANKNTSVVLIGEEKSVMLTNIIYIINYIFIIPMLPISYEFKLGYLILLPLRWWQSLRLNKPNWWNIKYYYNSIPFIESLTVLFTGISILIMSYFSL